MHMFRVFAIVQESTPIGALVFEASAVASIDTSAAATLRNVCSYLKNRHGIKVLLRCVDKQQET